MALRPTDLINFYFTVFCGTLCLHNIQDACITDIILVCLICIVFTAKYSSDVTTRQIGTRKTVFEVVTSEDYYS